jgi:hypothetical protein
VIWHALLRQAAAAQHRCVGQRQSLPELVSMPHRCFLGSSARTAVSKFGVERKPQTKLNHQNTTNKLVQAATPGAKFLHGRNMCTLAICGNANQGLAKLRMAKLRRLPLVCTCDVGTDCAPEAPLACCLWCCRGLGRRLVGLLPQPYRLRCGRRCSVLRICCMCGIDWSCQHTILSLL